MPFGCQNIIGNDRNELIGPEIVDRHQNHECMLLRRRYVVLDRAPRAFIQAKSAKRFDALNMLGVCHNARKCIAAGSYPVHKVRGSP